MFAVVSVAEPERHIFVFNTGADAGKCAADFNATARNAGDTKRYRVVPIKGETVADDWKQREIRRFIDGAYTPVPWNGESWRKVDHFAHISTDDAGKVAFTPNAEYGAADRQIRMRPGRYLAQHYADVLNPEQIKEWCAKLAAEDTPLKFAHTPDEIQWVYEHGPNSCMSHNADDYESSCHPVRVYGAGDLAVAYTMNGSDRVSARALCWPAKKCYGRAYGDDNLLKELLVDAGYWQGRNASAWNGARLLRIEDDDGLVAPYLDDPNDSVTDDGEFLVLSSRGDICCRETEGLVREGGRYRCDHCEDRMDEDDCCTVGDETWCRYCSENYAFWCHDCEETFAGSPHLCDHRGNDICGSCASEYDTCARCDETFHNDDVTYSEVTDEHYCDGCASRYMERTPCGEIAENEHDCECSVCLRERADNEAEDFELSEDDPALTVRPQETERFVPVTLKPTSPRIDDPRQLVMYVWEIHPDSAWRNQARPIGNPIEPRGIRSTYQDILAGRLST